MNIAITGGIGSGKSLVGKLLKEKGYPVFSCDEIYKEITREKEYLEKIAAEFPFAVPNGELDKTALSSYVFSNRLALEKLNSIAHPLIMKRLKKQMQNSNGELVFAEVPLLFEANLQSQFDAVIVVLRSLSKRVEAVKLRDGVAEKDVLERIACQYDYENNKGYLIDTYYAIQNDGNLFQLEEQLLKTLMKITQS